MKNKLWYRQTIQYKIKMWFYRLTFRDVEKATKNIVMFVFEIIMAILVFGFVLILPAIFH